jgi:hypothetical protein
VRLLKKNVELIDVNADQKMYCVTQEATVTKPAQINKL